MMRHLNFSFWNYFADKKYTELKFEIKSSLKLFEVFTHAIKTFFVNAKFMLK